MSDKVGRVAFGPHFDDAVREVREFREHEEARLNDWREADGAAIIGQPGVNLKCSCGRQQYVQSDDERTCPCGKTYRLRYDVEVRG